MGDGAGTTIVDGGGLDRIFQVPAGVTAEIHDVTLRNGRGTGLGGAILNAGTLTLIRSVLSGNTSAAGADGPGYGGAIYSNGASSTLTVTDSTVFGQHRAERRWRSGGGRQPDPRQRHPLGQPCGFQLRRRPLHLWHRPCHDQQHHGHRQAAPSRAAACWSENNPFIGTAPEISNSIIAGNTATTSQPDCWGPVNSSYNLIGIGTSCNGPSAARNDQVRHGRGPHRSEAGRPSSRPAARRRPSP